MPRCLGNLFTLKFAFSLFALLLSAAVFSHSSHSFLCSDTCQTDPCHDTPVQHALHRKQEDSASVKGNWLFQRAVCRCVGWGWAFKPDARRQPSSLLPSLSSCHGAPHSLHSSPAWGDRRWREALTPVIKGDASLSRLAKQEREFRGIYVPSTSVFQEIWLKLIWPDLMLWTKFSWSFDTRKIWIVLQFHPCSKNNNMMKWDWKRWEPILEEHTLQVDFFMSGLPVLLCLPSKYHEAPLYLGTRSFVHIIFQSTKAQWTHA